MVDQAQLLITVDASHLMEVLLSVEDELAADKMVDEASTLLLNRTRQRFLQELDPDGNPWIPSQAAIDRRGHGGTGTLFDTGTLWRSIQLTPAQGDSLQAERSITAGAFNKKGVEYGQFAQHGTKYMPKRRFLGLNQDDIDTFEHRVMQRVAEKLGVA